VQCSSSDAARMLRTDSGLGFPNNFTVSVLSREPGQSKRIQQRKDEEPWCSPVSGQNLFLEDKDNYCVGVLDLQVQSSKCTRTLKVYVACLIIKVVRQYFKNCKTENVLLKLALPKGHYHLRLAKTFECATWVRGARKYLTN
jgi:hypothetical protein